MEHKNKGNLKEQNSSRITEPKNGLTVTKGKGTGEDGWEGKDNGVEKESGGGLMINMCSVEGGHGEVCASQRRQVVILQHLTTPMPRDCEGLCGGDLVNGGGGKSLGNIMFLM